MARMTLAEDVEEDNRVTQKGIIQLRLPVEIGRLIYSFLRIPEPPQFYSATELLQEWASPWPKYKKRIDDEIEERKSIVRAFYDILA